MVPLLSNYLRSSRPFTIVKCDLKLLLSLKNCSYQFLHFFLQLKIHHFVVIRFLRSGTNTFTITALQLKTS